MPSWYWSRGADDNDEGDVDGVGCEQAKGMRLTKKR